MLDKSVLDLGRLQEIFEDDVAGIAELLEMSLGTGAKHVRALQAGIASADLTAVARAAHGIKGSASNVGANRVSALAADIEDRARAGAWEQIAALTEQVEAGYAQLRARISEYRAHIS